MVSIPRIYRNENSFDSFALQVRDFSFEPASGKLISIKYDRFSYAATLPGDLRDRMPTFPERLVTVFSVAAADVQQVCGVLGDYVCFAACRKVANLRWQLGHAFGLKGGGSPHCHSNGPCSRCLKATALMPPYSDTDVCRVQRLPGDIVD